MLMGGAFILISRWNVFDFRLFVITLLDMRKSVLCLFGAGQLACLRHSMA